MIIELQLDSKPVITMIRNQVKAARAPVPDPISFTVAPNDVINVYVDHIELNATTLKPSIERFPIAGSGAFQVPMLQLYQDLTIMLATDGELKLRNQKPMHHDTFLQAQITVIFDIKVVVDSSGAQLCVGVSDIQSAVLTPDEIDRLKNMIHISRCNDLDISELTAFTGKLDLTNAGVAVSSDGKRIALRFEVGVGSLTAHQWLAFMDGEVDDFLHGRDWAIFIDGELITDTIESQLYAGFDFNKMGLQEGPFATWQPAGLPPEFIPHAQATFSGWIRDACTTIFGVIDLGFDATIDANVSVPVQDLLQMDVAAEWSGDKGAEFLCGFSNILFGAVTGVFSPVQGYGWVGMAMSLNPGGPLVNLILYIWAFNSGFLNQFIPTPPKLEKVDDSHYRMQVPFKAPGGLPVSNMHLDSAYATPKGLVVGGSFDPVVELADPRLVIESWSDKEFHWYNDDPCHQSVPYLELKLYFRDSPYPLQLAPPIVLHDPKKQYKQSIYEWDEDGIQLKMLSYVPDFAPGYECDLVLLTSGGARYLTFPKPASLHPFKNDQDQLDYEVGLIGWRAGNCFRATSIWNQIGMYNPKWSVDPGPDGPEEGVGDLHVWSVMVSGLSPSDRIALTDAGGRPIGEAIAGARGAVQLDATVAPARGNIEITISRNGAQMPYAEYIRNCRELERQSRSASAVGTLMTTQVQLGRVAEIQLGGAATSLLSVQAGGVFRIVVVTRAGLEVWEIAGDATKQTERRAIAGLAGAVAWSGTLIGYGTFGLIDLSAPHAKPFAAGPVVACAVANGRLIALTAKGLDVYDQGLATKHIRVRGGRSLTTSGAFLVTSGAEELTIHDFNKPDSPALRTVANRKTEVVIPVALWAGRRGVFVSGSDGGGLVYELGGTGLSEPIATYKSAPWFLRDVRKSQFIARVNEKGTAAEVFRVQGTRITGTEDCDCSCASKRESDAGRFIPPEVSSR